MSNILSFKGKVEKVLDVETITSKKGETFQKQSIVVKEEKDKYPQRGAFEFFGKSYETLSESGAKEGDVVEIKFSLESREWKGKYYPSLKGYGIDVVSSNNTAPEESPAPAPSTTDDDCGLPF